MRPVREFEDVETIALRGRLADQVREAVADENWWFVVVGHVDGTQRMWRIKGAPNWKTKKHLARQLIAAVKFMCVKVPGPLIQKLRGVLERNGFAKHGLTNTGTILGRHVDETHSS